MDARRAEMSAGSCWGCSTTMVSASLVVLVLVLLLLPPPLAVVAGGEDREVQPLRAQERARG